VAFQRELADFGAFYERTYQVAFRTALAIVRDRDLAAEVTQEAYVEAYRRRASFRGDAPGFAWLHRIVVNEALQAVRRRRWGVREIDVAALSHDGDVKTTVDRTAIFGALDRLPARQRAAVVLRYYHDYDYATIARILGTTSTNVGAMLTRARVRLRVDLQPPLLMAERGR